MTSYDDFVARESRIWTPFKYALRFTTAQAIERSFVFGIYSGFYKNGMNYLRSFNDFELSLILDDYNQKMADLDAEEQNFILEIAAKRYVARIEDLMDAEKQASRLAGIRAEDEAWDYKFDALEADRAALLTLEAQYQSRIRDIQARIATLRAQILIEGAEFQLVEIDVANKELDLIRAENELVGKEIDLALKDVEISGKDVTIAQKRVDRSQKKIELQEQTNAIWKLRLAEAQAEERALEVANDILKIQLSTVNESLKYLEAQKEAAQIQVQAAGYTSDIAKTALIEVDLSEATTEKTLADIELTEKDIQAEELRVDLAKVGMDKKQIDFDYQEVNRDVAGLIIDKHNTWAKSYDINNLAYELEKVNVDREVDMVALSLYDSRRAVINSQTATITAEVSNEQAETANITAIHGAEMSILSSEQAFALDAIANRIDDVKRSIKKEEDMEQLQLDLLNAKIPKDTAFVDLQITGIKADTKNEKRRYETEVNIYQQLMEAELLTTLKHSIGKE